MKTPDTMEVANACRNIPQRYVDLLASALRSNDDREIARLFRKLVSEHGDKMHMRRREK